MDTTRRDAAITAFSRLCRGLDAPLQVLVRQRALDETSLGVTSVASGFETWDSAMREHWSVVLRDSVAFRRTVLVAVRCARRPALDRARARLHASLRAIGAT